MDRSIRPVDAVYGAAVGAETRQRVMRNTYALLALSMLPTVAGAWLGMAMGFTFFAGKPLVGFMVFMAVAFGFMFAIEKFKNSGVGVALLLGFTFFMGLMLSRMIGYVAGLANGAQIIGLAFGTTAVVFASMAALAGSIKRDLSSMGKFLFMGVMVILAAIVANIFLQIPALSLTISALVAVVFSAYLLYDLKRILDGGETNYISATLALYLDVYNIFTSLLHLFTAFGGSDD
ncbi:BAX inhibitor (BI)-1/YccA family protein [Aquabacterium fontiphilum]|jgi:modulator of FtsH protease|uniref:Bax inhibitor-1/YccA family protein n=1 Tax=Aquabacterium fontiphilum TaxID=450365 RepID=UPI001377943A|nr:Bax inhibitor-1/YccA family protein [Aquabacterium fontiphilum]NBD21485.1 BAX inhibitor (BI)-1/YccA family protein [Aquabacterium fontiphilum]